MIITRKQQTGRGRCLKPRLEPGKVYRTADLSRYDQNPTRLAAKLVSAGQLRRLRKGLYYAPKHSVFGEVPPSEDEFLRSFFRGRPYLRSGPTVWNGLGLGATAVEAVPLVYNTTRTGSVKVGGKRLELRRVAFPRRTSAEFFVVDLLENLDRAGVDADTVRRALKVAVRAGRFQPDVLRELAIRYGGQATRAIIDAALEVEAPQPR